MRGGASAEADGPGAAVGAAVTAAAVLAYTLALRRYGLDLVDEGTLLAQFADVARGGVPYRDFQTGYGPLIFYWNGALLRLVGMDVTSVRAALAVVHAVGAGLLYALARRAGGGRVATVGIVIVWGMLRPVAPGAFALFNVPYPGWYAEALGYGAVLLLLVGGPASGGRLLLLGALWGIAFLAKQNAGLLGLAGTIVHLAITAPPARPASGIDAWGTFLAIAMLGGLGALWTWSPMTWTELLLLGTPVALLAVAVVRARPSSHLVRTATLAGAGFLAVIVPSLVGLAAVVGRDAVLAGSLQLDVATAQGFRLPYPTPAAILADGFRDWGDWPAAGRALVDQLWMLVFPAVAIVGAARLAWAPRGIPTSQVALTSIGGLGYLQLYPRADQWHALAASGLLVILALILVDGRLRRGGAVALMVLALARSVPTGPVLVSLARQSPPDGPTVSHASLRWDLMRPAHLARLPDVVAELENVHSLFGFPALAFLNFVTGAPSPTRHDYFFPGVPGPAGVAETFAALRADPPDAVVLLDAPVAFFPQAFDAYPALVALLRSDRWTRMPIPPYEVGRRAGP